MRGRHRFLTKGKRREGKASEPDEAVAASAGSFLPMSLQLRHHTCVRLEVLSCTQDAELLQRSRTIVQPDLLGDLAILHTQHGRSREVHFPAGGRRK